MKFAAIAFIFAVASAGAAAAQSLCEHEGEQFPEGAQICASGWQQECTVGGYWRAVGYCRADDPSDPGKFTSIEKPDGAEAPESDKPAAE